MNRVTASFTTSYSIYDSWAELLAGTRLLLNLSEDQGRDTIAKINLLRLVLVSSHQMTEVMFFSQLGKRIKQQSEVVKKLFEYDLEHRISFSNAIQKWPALITGRSLNFSSEPLQSMKSLSNHRNSAIHHTAKYPSGEFGVIIAVIIAAVIIAVIIATHKIRVRIQNSIVNQCNYFV